MTVNGNPDQVRREIRGPSELDSIRLDASGLVPVVVQDRSTGGVLMVAWANREALELTFETGTLHFWSRSRRCLWQKGETSGNIQSLASLYADCDRDTLLAHVDPRGPACHTGEVSCFDEQGGTGGSAVGPGGTGMGATLARVAGVVASRGRERPEGSYTTRLLEDENLRLGLFVLCLAPLGLTVVGLWHLLQRSPGPPSDPPRRPPGPPPHPPRRADVARATAKSK